MSRQSIHGVRQRLQPGGSVIARLSTGIARSHLFLGTGALSAYGAVEMYGVMSSIGLTPLQWIFLALFVVNFTWISFAACQALLGFVRRFFIDLLPHRRCSDKASAFRTAILAPVYNETPAAVAAALSAIADGLAELAPERFTIFILSDSNRPDDWIREEAVFARLIAESGDGCEIYYRHRRDNDERKAGNICDWVTRWGGGYDAMLVLDADSLMTPETVVELANRLEADPGLGLLQTLPAIFRARSFYARLQQFANRCYGPIFGNGLAAWHGRSSNFWGHNAIIRTAAFAEAARLPLLNGKPPFGGAVLSHDFIEAALLRRAGWGVRLDTDLAGSYEEAPPSLSDVMIRDRRWCQGNLQHAKFLLASGFSFASRLHLFSGIMAYLSAPLWLGLVLVGMIIAVQAAATEPVYFAGPSLFPSWPVFDTARAISLFSLSMAIVLTPKALGWLSAMLNPRRLLRFGGPLALTASVAVEVLMSALYAPVMMLTQSQTVCDILGGRDSGWAPQRRGNGYVRLRETFHMHRWQICIGLGFATIAYFLNPDLLFWLLPVTGGLVLAAFLSWISGSDRLGQGLSKLAILRTPEEKPPVRHGILTWYEDKLVRYAAPSNTALSLLQSDRMLRKWHLARLPASVVPRFDAPLILARAKAARASSIDALEAWLTTEELIAFLHDPVLVASLDQEALPQAS